MQPSSTTRLTDEERRALQAYDAEGSRKAAANVLGKSESTIATQLASARDKLGVGTTAAAVKRFRAEFAPHPERTNPPRTISPSADAAPDERAEHVGVAETAVRQVGSGYVPHPAWSVANHREPEQETRFNGLTTPQRLLAIVAIMALVIIALALAPLVAEGVQQWAFRQADQR